MRKRATSMRKRATSMRKRATSMRKRATNGGSLVRGRARQHPDWQARWFAIRRECQRRR